jgi:protein-S-isoprenylcysteine O-methyltransferase Ste14
MVEEIAYINALAIIVLLLYWELRERLTSKAQSELGGHRPWWRWTFRFLLPLVALVMVVQLLYDFAPLELSELQIPIVFWFGQILFWIGVGLSVWARETLGRHWAHAAEYQIIPGQALVTNGPYARIRHPIYTSFLLLFAGATLISGSVLVLLTIPLGALLYWQAGEEEKIMRTSFGTQYQDYHERTGAFLPRID